MGLILIKHHTGELDNQFILTHINSQSDAPILYHNSCDHAGALVYFSLPEKIHW